MNPAELERHIAECSERMQQAMAMYEISGAFSDRGGADFWRIAMEHAIRVRDNNNDASSHAKIA